MKFPRDWQGVKIKNLMLTLCDIGLSMLLSLILEFLTEKNPNESESLRVTAI